MCQDALQVKNIHYLQEKSKHYFCSCSNCQELKQAVKSSGEHKQRILLHVAVDGLKIRDEKSGVRRGIVKAVLVFHCGCMDSAVGSFWVSGQQKSCYSLYKHQEKEDMTDNMHIIFDEGSLSRDTCCCSKFQECVYHHPVHKVSFIAQDGSDGRAFGYVFGSPEGGHRFFGVKTEKASAQVVTAMRELFQVVFREKKTPYCFP